MVLQYYTVSLDVRLILFRTYLILASDDCLFLSF